MKSSCSNILKSTDDLQVDSGGGFILLFFVAFQSNSTLFTFSLIEILERNTKPFSLTPNSNSLVLILLQQQLFPFLFQL